MSNKKYHLKKNISELVDATLNLVHGDDKSHVVSNVQSKKTMDQTVQAQTQPYSFNKKLGFGAEYFSDASFSVSENDDKSKDLSEEKALTMIENIIKKRMKEDLLSKRSDLRDIDISTEIPGFDEFKSKFPIVSKYTTILTDRIKEKKQENIGEYGATILSEIMDSFNIDEISPKVKKILINKIKGISNINNI